MTFSVLFSTKLNCKIEEITPLLDELKINLQIII